MTTDSLGYERMIPDASVEIDIFQLFSNFVRRYSSECVEPAILLETKQMSFALSTILKLYKWSWYPVYADGQAINNPGCIRAWW